MDKLISEMKKENKYSRTTRQEELDIGTEYLIKALKCVETKHRNKIVIIIDFKGEMVHLFTPKYFDSKTSDLDKKFKKLGKDMALKVIERKGKDNNKYLHIDIELSANIK